MHNAMKQLEQCCGITFKTKSELQSHFRERHKSGYACTYKNCSSIFERRALLRRHNCTHTGEKKFSCKCCDYKTSNKSNLERHCNIKSHTTDHQQRYGAQSQPSSTENSQIQLLNEETAQSLSSLEIFVSKPIEQGNDNSGIKKKPKRYWNQMYLESSDVKKDIQSSPSTCLIDETKNPKVPVANICPQSSLRRAECLSKPIIFNPRRMWQNHYATENLPCAVDLSLQAASRPIIGFASGSDASESISTALIGFIYLAPEIITTNVANPNLQFSTWQENHINEFKTNINSYFSGFQCYNPSACHQSIKMDLNSLHPLYHQL
uniref:C2H2-type domain-containing protein n=1 Tax=Strigamia maritima TaxID=126957 RepID=T1J137_STRMM